MQFVEVSTNNEFCPQEALAFRYVWLASLYASHISESENEALGTKWRK